ncbi:MAG: beta-lactamase family protein [Lentisphaerae bacterium]|nr:beta-lactamase family protein [Lentisphaerota bacterium]
MLDLTSILQAGVAARAWPCAAAAVVSPRQPSRIFLAGSHTYCGDKQLRESDWFDLASLSKVLVTTTLVAQLCEQGTLSLNTTLAEIFPEFTLGLQAAWRQEVTIRHLLAHCSGLPAGYPFHQLSPDRRQDFRQILLSLPLTAAPGQVECYSDLGMMILGEVVVTLLGQNLDSLARQQIFSPLGLHDGIGYCPALQQRSSCVPTELCADSGQPWQGMVHDENARWLGGIAGHAGLFANITTLARLVQALFPSNSKLLPEDMLRLFTRPAGIIPASSRCLGWDSPSRNSSAGEHISPQGYGHTGFTGTCIWIDPEKELAVILLSNAVHPCREDKRHAYPEFLRQVCNAVFAGSDK